MSAPIRPVTTQPMVGVMLKRCVTVLASSSLSCRYASNMPESSERVSPTGACSAWQQPAFSPKGALLLTGTFLWVMSTAVSSPRIAIAVCPEPEMALKAYSTDVVDEVLGTGGANAAACTAGRQRSALRSSASHVAYIAHRLGIGALPG